MKSCHEKYRKENPCPHYGSHNVDIDIDCINGSDMSGSEWCNDCGWKRETTTRPLHSAGGGDAVISKFNERMISGSGGAFNPSIHSGIQFTAHQLNEHDTAIKAEAQRKEREDLISAILTRITEAQYDGSTMQDFINYVESLRRGEP